MAHTDYGTDTRIGQGVGREVVCNVPTGSGGEGSKFQPFSLIL
ncbi:MAG: hypothetical protein SWX82_05230 [Cyanobacteriota bacterium]|nr:hypothetical protein [Cyanobacteriota bacterium]